MYRKNNYYHKSNFNRNSNQKLFLKALFCVAGIIVLAFIASTYRNYKIREGKEPYVRVEEVKPVIEAFNKVQSKNADILIQPEQEYLTYGTLLQSLEIFPLEDISVLEDYKKTEWYVGLADWNQFLYQMVEAYGNGEIQVREQILLGTDRKSTRLNSSH